MNYAVGAVAQQKHHDLVKSTRGGPAMRVSVDNFRDDPMFHRIECVVADLFAKGNVVAPVDVLVGMGLLRPEHLNNWRRGRVPYLERVVNCNLTRLSRLLRILRFHAHDLNRKPSATVYKRYGKRPQATAALQQNRRRRPRRSLRDAFRMAGQAAVRFGRTEPAPLTDAL